MANTWGYGAMTNSLGDIQNAKAIIIFGANPAVNHPVGFQHFLKAKERNNAPIIVVDPVFTKTAAKADHYIRIRPGTDIPFMYGMLHLIFKHGWHDPEYIKNRVFGMDHVIKEAKKLKTDYGFELEFLKGEELKEKGFIGIYSVGKGSKNPPVFIHLIYKGKNPKKKIICKNFIKSYSLFETISPVSSIAKLFVLLSISSAF